MLVAVWLIVMHLILIIVLSNHAQVSVTFLNEIIIVLSCKCYKTALDLSVLCTLFAA